MQRVRDCGVISSKSDVYTISFPLKFINHCGRRYGKIVRLRDSEHLQLNSIFAEYMQFV